jgi:O-antigen/teichoic acid export membrane protein
MARRLEELRRGFIDVLSVVLILTLPVGLGIVLLAEPFVHVLLGAKWAEAVPLIQVLGMFGILRATASNIGSVYLALGMPRLVTYLALLHMAVLLSALVWLVRDHGAYGAALAVLLAGAIAIPANYAVAMRHLNLGFAALAASTWRPIAAGLCMALAVTGVRAYWVAANSPSYPLQLVVLVPIGAAFYVASVIAFWFFSSCPMGPEHTLLVSLKSVWNKKTR